MTSDKPGPDPNNPAHLIGGTKFERLGQQSVKDGRCYSLSMTHQRQRALVGPTSGGKVFDPLEDHEDNFNNSDNSKNLEIRSKIIKVSTFSCSPAFQQH
jgi:hypothetical protein